MKKKKLDRKIDKPHLLFIAFSLCIVAALFVGKYFYETTNNLTKVNNNKATIAPTSKEHQLEYAKIDDTLAVKLGENVYIEEDEGVEYPQKINVIDPSSKINWKELPLTLSEGEHIRNSIFDIKSVPNSENFLLVSDSGTRHIFLINPNNVIETNYPLLSFSNNSLNAPFPVISTVSSDGEIVVVDLYDCWDCGGHLHQKVLFKTSLNEDYSRTVVNLGQTSEFSLNSDNSYTYVPYPQECALTTELLESDDPAAMQEECLKTYSASPITEKLQHDSSPKQTSATEEKEIANQELLNQEIEKVYFNNQIDRSWKKTTLAAVTESPANTTGITFKTPEDSIICDPSSELHGPPTPHNFSIFPNQEFSFDSRQNCPSFKPVLSLDAKPYKHGVFIEWTFLDFEEAKEGFLASDFKYAEKLDFDLGDSGTYFLSGFRNMTHADVANDRTTESNRFYAERLIFSKNKQIFVITIQTDEEKTNLKTYREIVASIE
jgi:hypothetical protein